MVKISLVGTMSTGKSTLVEALKKEDIFKNYSFFTERSKYLSENGVKLNTDSTYKGQLMFFAERARELMYEDFIADRSIIDVMAFTSSSKTISNSEKVLFSNIAETLVEEYDYIFYIPIVEEIEMEDNGVRETNLNYREEIDKSIIRLAKIFGNKTNIIKLSSITIEGRAAEIKRVIENDRNN